MSAYICAPDHFIALAVFAGTKTKHGQWNVDPRYVAGLTHPEAASRGIENFCDYEIATLYGDLLYQENIRSVRARYPDDTWSDLPGLIHKPLHIVVQPEHFRSRAYRMAPVSILKMCDGLEYQSCETDDYRSTIGYRLLEEIRRAAISALPGYEDAPWEYDASEQEAA